MSEEFSLKNRAIQSWLFFLLLASGAIAGAFPPSFWLCAVGALLLAVASLSNSARTNQWYSWQNEGSLTWFEGWAAASGAVLLVVPLFAIIFRSWFAA